MDSVQSNSQPLVSILITSYNRARWIGQAIESAMAQDYENLEIIISDDGSTDNSHEVINKYTNDPRIRYSRNEKNLGMIPNFNKTFFELASGEYVTQLGSDDFFNNPQFISKAIALVKKYENIVLIFGKTDFIDINDKQIGRSFELSKKYEKEFRTGRDAFLDFVDNPYVYYTSGAVIYSLKHLKENRIFFEGRITADLELNLQLMMHGNVAFIDEQIYIIRRHGNNASTSVTDLHELEYSYLDLLRVIYNKAKITWPDEQALDEWYNKTILRHLEKSIYLVRLQNNYKLSMQFHRILYKKYRREYLNLIKKHPKYILKIILNR